MVSHSSQNLSCDACSYNAIHIQDLGRHKRSMHPVQTYYSCKLCDYCSTDKSEFQEHCKVAHINETRIFNRSRSAIHRCDLCSYNPLNINDLRRHIQTMHNTSSKKNQSNERKQVYSSMKPSSTENSSAHPFQSSSESAKDFHCPGGCTSVIKRFGHKDELELHMSFYHTTQ